MLEALHLQYFFGALVSLIVITNPPTKIPLFVSLTVGMTREQRHQQANWAAIYSFLVMLVSLIAGNLLLNFLTVPDFIAYKFEDRRSYCLRSAVRVWGAQEVNWTIRKKEDLLACEAAGGIPIFECFDPEA